MNRTYTFTENEYNAMYTAYQNGEISYENWVAYTTKLLFGLMSANKDVFVRLKNV